VLGVLGVLDALKWLSVPRVLGVLGVLLPRDAVHNYGCKRNAAMPCATMSQEMIPIVRALVIVVYKAIKELTKLNGNRPGCSLNPPDLRMSNCLFKKLF